LQTNLHGAHDGETCDEESVDANTKCPTELPALG